MSAQSMLGASLFVGSSIGEGELVFSDGTIQTTAYDPDSNGDEYINGSLVVYGNTTLQSTTIYGNIQQILSDTSSLQYGTNNLNSATLTGVCNTSIGQTALNNCETGSYNVALGNSTLQNITSGNQNTAIGSGACTAASSASGNTCIGYNSGASIYNGNSNTLIGSNANSAFSNSTAIGYNSTVTSNYQIMLGTSSETVVCPGNLTIDGFVQQELANENTQYGSNSLLNNTTGANNTAFGTNALALNQSGYQNSAFGDYALNSNVSGIQNVAVGHNSQEYTTGNLNTSLGCVSLQNNTTGSYNTCIGFNSGSSNTTGNTNVCIGYNSNSGNYSYSTALGQSSTNTSNHQVMLGTASETVQCPNVLNVANVLNVGSNYNNSNTLNILGGLNVNDVSTGVSANNNINGSTNTIVGAVLNTIESPTINLTSDNTNIAGNCNVGTNSTSSICNVLGNSVIGSSSSNTSTVNAIPNFVNGFKCAGGNSFSVFCGTATYVDGSIDCFSANGISVCPQLNAGGTGVATYSLDQTIPNIIGGFVNCSNYYFSFWYYYQPASNQIIVAFSNLSTNYQNLPTTINYMCFK